MKSILIFIILLFLQINCVYGQLFNLTPVSPEDITKDSSLSEFYPLQKGNIWQYRVRDYLWSSGYLETTACTGDTIMQNGKTYRTLQGNTVYFSNPKYCRIDAGYQVQEYLPLETIKYFYDFYGSTYCDSSLFNSLELSFFHLNEPDSAYWYTCGEIGDNLFLPGLMYLGEFYIDVFNQTMKAKYYIQYYNIYNSSDSSWKEMYGNSYILVKGMGLYYAEFHDSQTKILEGAIINGIKYGNLVGVEEEGEKEPVNFTLFQNYPNPFNPTTTIAYSLVNAGKVKIKVYDILGSEIATLVDDIKETGYYTTSFNASNLASGLYFARITINSNNLAPYIKTIKMMLAK